MNATDLLAESSGISRWSRLRTTFGPAAAGLLGGGLSGLLALPGLSPLCRNVAETYARYPSLSHPATPRLDLPGWLTFVALVLGLLAPVATGALVVWQVRPRDAWADLSAGLTAALAATLTALVACVGWPVVLALVVVPSIADLTALSEPAQATPAALAQRYPDLKGVEPAERTQALMPKIIADQVSGGMHAVWVASLLALVTAGGLALAGTIAAGYLRRRGDRFVDAALPYLELTLPASATLAVVSMTVISPVWEVLLGHNPLAVNVFSLLGLAALSILMVFGVMRHWPWWLRLCLALTWLLVLVQSGNALIPWPLPLVGAVLCGFLLGRHQVALYRALPARGLGLQS